MSNWIQSEKGPAYRSRFICKWERFKLIWDMEKITHRGNEEKKENASARRQTWWFAKEKKITQNQRNGFPFKFHHTDFPYSSRIQQRVVINVSFVVFRWLTLIETNASYSYLSRLLRDAGKRWVSDTASGVTESCDGSIIRPACELVLHGLGEGVALHDWIYWYFVCKVMIKILRIQGVDLLWFPSVS